jgi:hypothetical protein
MGMLRDRLALTDGSACLRGTGQTVTAVVGCLESGELPVKLIRPDGLVAADLIAALAQNSLGDDQSMGTALMQASPANRALLPSLSESAWVAVFPSVPHRTRLNLSAGLLQIHDFWDASHDAAQRADDLGERDFSAYWHGIAHRREPDAGNAAYWFRRVGKHAVFKPLAVAARTLLDQEGDAQLRDRLIPGGVWNPMVMIELCTQAQSGTREEIVARKLQRLEMWLLLEATGAAITG